jgi:hypothetical protein
VIRCIGIGIEKRYFIFGSSSVFVSVPQSKKLTVIEVSNVELHLFFSSSTIVVISRRGAVISGCIVAISSRRATAGSGSSFRHLVVKNE